MAKRKCNVCSEEVESTSIYCPKCGNKMNKKNKLLFFLLMCLVFFVIFEIVFTIFGGVLLTTLPNYKYGEETLGELLLIIFMVIVLIVFGNSYVFKEKKVGFFKGLLIGLPMLLFSIVLLVGSIFDSIEGLNLANLINLIMLCAGVGIAEEFLCRAWLQNEFMENFGSDRKGVVYSIICSSIVFGVMHITNGIFSTQTMFETFLQIIQALGSGVLFGAVYYKTKNIWVNAFLHGFFDFSIMLSEVNLIKDCTNNYVKSSDMAIGIISSILVILFYLSCAYFAFSSKNGLPFIKKDKLKKARIISIILCIVTFGITFIPDMFLSSDVTTCYRYEDKVLNEVYEIVTTNRKEYGLTFDDHEVKIYTSYKDYKKIVVLSIDDRRVDLSFDEDVEDFIVIDNKDYIEILIHTYFVESDIYYGRIYKDKISEIDSNYKNKLNEYKLPDLKSIGYIIFDRSDNKYPYMESKLGDKFYIDEEVLYLIK